MTPDPMALLSATERFWYRVADAFARRFVTVGIVWNFVFMVNIVRLVAARRLVLDGFEHAAALRPEDRVVLVCNHRSFFDYFVVGAMMYTRTTAPRRVMFPVRSPFFYDTLLGGMINGVLAAFTMFPPIVRDGARSAWNKFASDRLVEALHEGPLLVGYHPEGKRGTGPDPYALLPGHAGVGRIVLDGPPGTKVVPVFVIGMTNSFGGELRRNWLHASEFPIGVVFGPEIPFEDLRGQGHAHAALTERIMAGIADLAAWHRAHRGESFRAASRLAVSSAGQAPGG